MRALLDVNVLIALLDADHTLHAAAAAWFGEHARQGWASCPITQNGCVRIMSGPSYPAGSAPSQVIKRLRDATGHELHEFWPDEITLLDPKVVDSSRIHGPRQLTDLYLLALAVHKGGRLVTFDQSISLEAVAGAAKRNLVIL